MMPNLQHVRQQQSKQTPRTCLRSICTWSARGLLQPDLHVVRTWSTPLSTNWFPFDIIFGAYASIVHFPWRPIGGHRRRPGEDTPDWSPLGPHLVCTQSQTWTTMAVVLSCGRLCGHGTRLDDGSQSIATPQPALGVAVSGCLPVQVVPRAIDVVLPTFFPQGLIRPVHWQRWEHTGAVVGSLSVAVCDLASSGSLQVARAVYQNV